MGYLSLTMRIPYKLWKPSIGEKISGRILFFDNPEGASVVLLRTENDYFLLSRSASDVLLAKKPEDGTHVQIEYVQDGYRFTLLG